MNLEDIRNVCREENIHEVCFCCTKECKCDYNHWSGQMPPNIFCDEFNEYIPLTKLIRRCIT